MASKTNRRVTALVGLGTGLAMAGCGHQPTAPQGAAPPTGPQAAANPADPGAPQLQTQAANLDVQALAKALPARIAASDVGKYLVQIPEDKVLSAEPSTGQHVQRWWGWGGRWWGRGLGGWGAAGLWGFPWGGYYWPYYYNSGYFYPYSYGAYPYYNYWGLGLGGGYYRPFWGRRWWW